MSHLIAVIVALVVVPASASAEPIPTSTPFDGQLFVLPVELDASQLGLDTSQSALTIRDPWQSTSGVSAATLSASSLPANAGAPPSLRTIVIIESDRGVHLIETDPVSRVHRPPPYQRASRAGLTPNR